MNAKQYLNQIRKYEVLITNKEEQLKALQARAVSTTAQMGGERVQTSSSHDTHERIMVAILDLENELSTKINDYIKLKKEVIKVIDQLQEATHIDILYKRYISFKKWDDIADDMGYSIQAIFKIHGIALLEIQKIIDQTNEEK